MREVPEVSIFFEVIRYSQIPFLLRLELHTTSPIITVTAQSVTSRCGRSYRGRESYDRYTGEYETEISALAAVTFAFSKNSLGTWRKRQLVQLVISAAIRNMG